MTDPARVRSRSLWLDTLDDPYVARAPLPGDTQADVAIIGGGLTGLWTAYYLSEADPGLRIAVVEAETAGFGASGRNGGWCSALLPMSWEAMAKEHGRAGAIAMQREMHHTVDEVGRIATKESIDIDWAKGGYLHLATNPAHVGRIHEHIEHARAWGFGEDDTRWLDRAETAERMNVPGVLGASYTPHCAAIHPAKLVRGLARVVEARGVTIYEGTRASSIGDRVVETDRGRLRAEVVVRATEGYTARLDGMKRDIVPIYSLMVATEPLPPSFFDEVGWAARETFNDGRHLIIYGQRTADGRIAFGGRGAPYHFGSAITDDFDRDDHVHEDLQQVLRGLFPQLADVAFTHRWGGPLGAPRDWYCSVGFDRQSGYAWAGGYVGDGVATTNLSGRTLADLITGADTDLVHLPWVGHRSRRWEPEPLRWLGINTMLKLPSGSDRHEERTGRPEKPRSWVLGKIIR